MKILLIDIETSPNLGYVWELWQQNIALNQIAASGEMLCFAAKWYQQPDVMFYSDWTHGHYDMVGRAWDLVHAADVVVHYNGRKFDMPWLQREWVETGMRPPSPVKQVDLYEVVRKTFQFPSNKLEYVVTKLGIGNKVKHEGFELWLKVMNGDPEARARFREYNIQDVNLLEPLYDRLQPWIPGHPSYGAFTGEDVCPKCGSDSLSKEGHAYTQTGRYQRYVCGVCGAWSRASKRDESTGIVQVAA